MNKSGITSLHDRRRGINVAGGAFAPGKSLLRNPLDLIAFWDRRLEKRRCLVKLPDYLLADIGLTREQAEAEYKTPFWKEGIY